MVSPQSRLAGVVGDRTAKVLKESLGLETVDDLLRHYPRRYVDISTPDSLDELEAGQYATFVARVTSVKNYPFGPGGRKVRTQVVVTDGDSELLLTFFQQRWISKQLAVGSVHVFAGEVGMYRSQKQLTHPTIRPATGVDGEDGAVANERSILPIYRASKKISSWEIERAIEVALAVLDDVPDPIPIDIRVTHDLVSLRQAFDWVHRPTEPRQHFVARHRLRFEEAFVLQTVFAIRRQASDRLTAVARPLVKDRIRSQFERRLPFDLTAGQQQVSAEISADLAKPKPMHRLLQGEVGSGKTIIALLAMLQVIDSGGQAVLLAPTEVLATQHFRSISEQLGDLAQAGTFGSAPEATRVTLLTGSLSTRQRKEALLEIASGSAGIVIGTHALLERTVQYAELALVVIDEQHRFGVEQRSALSERASDSPHVLVMTATPIPRTVAMTVFGDLETSTLAELPRGRQPIQTTVIAAADQPHWLDRAWERLVEEITDGRQAYVVASRIGDGDLESDDSVTTDEATRPTTSVIAAFEELSSGALKDLRLGLMHGRMTADEKDDVMRRFKLGDVQVLVATTVIEVGVDVPNASMMVILDADRFGMSQLHQLRGRVGRGQHAGLCLLVTNSPTGSPARSRLAAVAATNDGFELARMDIELRREGDVLGARQSGFGSSLKLLSVVRDEGVILTARESASSVIVSDPNLDQTPELRRRVEELELSNQAEFLEKA